MKERKKTTEGRC